MNVLKENKTLKAKSNNEEDKTTDTDSEDNKSIDEEILTKSKYQGYKRTTPQSQPEKCLTCPVCKDTFKTESVLKNHMKYHKKEGDWTCDECSYQTNGESNLRDHKLRAHEKGIVGGDQPEATQNKSRESTCIRCNQDFIYRLDLKKHINDAHKTYKPCRNLKTCTYLPKCKYNHQEYPQGTQICYECGKTFKTAHDLMRHRKKHTKLSCASHSSKVIVASPLRIVTTHMKTSTRWTCANCGEYEGTKCPSTPGFLGAPSNLAPPSSALQPMRHGPTQSEWIQLKQTLSQINQMMAKFF